MSRWGRGRGGAVAVPIDHLFRENSNCPTAARSAGTVGKWGVTSFTSIRTAPYGFSQAPGRRACQDRNTTVAPVESASSASSAPDAPPKPKKFFKSRNAASSENAAVAGGTAAPPDAADAFPSYSRSKPLSYSKKPKNDGADTAEKLEIPKLKIHVERSPKTNKNKFFATKASKKEDFQEEKTHLSPNKRYLSRNRDKIINYSEEDADSPLRDEEPPVAAEPAKVATPKTSPAAACVKPGLLSPTSKDAKPPIVLRISKGTSRLLSTDSEEVLPSPDATPTPEAEPEPPIPEPIPESEEPSKESLKITIKCYQGNKTNKKPDEVEPAPNPPPTRSTRSSRRNRRESGTDDTGKPCSPTPGSENYELYRTLASPSSPEHEETPPETSDPPPDSEKTSDDDRKSDALSGRAMRHRQNINYNENAANYVDDVTSNRLKNAAKSYTRKIKKKDAQSDSQAMDVDPPISAEHLESTPPSDAPEPTQSEDEPKPKLKRLAQKNPLDFDADEFDDDEIMPTEKPRIEQRTFKSPKRPENLAPGDDSKPSVKLVITKKKGSIFKSRSLVNDGPGATGKKRHLYKHKWADDGKGGQTPRPEPETSSQVNLQEFDEGPILTRVTRYQKDKSPSLEDEIVPYTSVKCPKNAKDYYTVVRNVKKAHQIQEIGEFQEFNDDVEYILDALQDNNPMSTRCLSAITLASKCTAPAFRMHVRAHGTVAKFFRALHDATNDQSLGLCTATVMFVLSQDRLNMDLDRESLELMLNLLESDVSHKDALDDCGLTSAQLAKNKERVRELCAEIKSEGKANHLDLDNITVGHLAMETLLSLTSKRAGEWFKEELRVLGGVDHILSTICDCCAKIGDYVAEWTPTLLDLLRKIDRCMRVLENITQQNEENQTYLVNWKNRQAVDTLVRLFKLCDREIPLYPTSGPGVSATNSVGATIRDALLPTLKVLINLTHSFRPGSMGSTVVGEQQGIIESSLHLLLQAPNYIPDSNNFEFSVCVLLLLINLMQNNAANIQLLLNAKAPSDFESVFASNKPAVQGLIDHFYKREELARMAEQNTDAILEGGEKGKEDEKKNKSHDEFIEETVAKLLQKAGTHMEHTMVASYIVLLLGHVVLDNRENEDTVRRLLPNNSFEDMISVLKKYFNFLNLTASAEAASVAHVKATEKVISYLEKCEKVFGQEGSSNGQSRYGEVSDLSVDKEDVSFNEYSNLDVTNNSKLSTESTSDSGKMSSSLELDSSFN